MDTKTYLEEQTAKLVEKRARMICKRIGVKLTDMQKPQAKVIPIARYALIMLLKQDGFTYKCIGELLMLHEYTIGGAFAKGYHFLRVKQSFRDIYERGRLNKIN